MVWHPTKDAVLRLWGRRWVRRVSYCVVAGATALTVGPWLATRPVVLQWAVGRLDALVQRETGLTLAVSGVELHPALGRLVLHGVRLGGDLLTVERIELQADPWGLLRPTRRIHALRLEHPHLRLTEAGLAAFHLRERPPRTEPLPQVILELISLTGGEVVVPVPLRGFPALQFQFDVKATGSTPNQLRLDLAGAQLSVQGPAGWEKGRLDLNGDLSEAEVLVREAYLRLGDSQVRLSGRYAPGTPADPHRLEGRLGGVLDIAQGLRWAGLIHPPASGNLDLTATVQGSLRNPTWTFTAEGQGLHPARGGFAPGDLELRANGTLRQARLERVVWSSPQGLVEAQGEWGRETGLRATLDGTDLDLEAAGLALHLPEFQGVRATLQAQVQGPLPVATNRWSGHFGGTLSQGDREAGAFEATLADGRAILDRLHLDLKDLQLEGKGEGLLDRGGLLRAEGEGRAQVGVGQVARALVAWGLVPLDMDGQARAQAKARWTRTAGLDLEGRIDVTHPRWHGAAADSLGGRVEIKGADLWIKALDLRRGDGHAEGDLWLTWATLPPGQRQTDMCFSAFRLPLAEGLQAVPLQDANGRKLPLDGLASGWVRMEGPFRQLRLSGNAQVESAEVYGLRVPVVSSDFTLNLETLQLALSDLRVAERRELLGYGELPPEGALALTGQAQMDFDRWTWWVDLGGRLDTHPLALPGPRFQAQVEARLLGPITAPFGALDLPQGRVSFSRGRLFFAERSVDGLQGLVRLERGLLEGNLAVAGQARPLLAFKVAQTGLDLAGNLDLLLSPESADTGPLARSLTGDLLEDLSLRATATGRWKPGQDLAWRGSVDALSARFKAFELHQVGASALVGDLQGAGVDLSLEGGGRSPADAAATQAAQLHLSGTVPFTADGPLALQARGAADLGHLKAILDRVMEVDEYSLLSDLRVAGTSRFDLLAHGTYRAPLLGGTLGLEKGQARLRGYQGVEDLRAEVVLKDRTITLPATSPLRGTMAHGDLRLTGSTNWQPGGLDRYALEATLANFQLRDLPEGLDLQGTLRASLEGGEEGGLLKGTLRADRLNFQTEVKLTDLILRSALTDTSSLLGLDLDDPLDRIRLDLDLELRNPWSFDTNLLKLEGRTEGPFQVLGTLAHPVPKGKLVFQPGGRLTNIFPAGDMVVDRGSLAFSEARALDPMISLQGSVSSIPGYTVNLDIRGTLSNLAIVPSSIPSLRQDEIVAILINPGNAAYVGTAGATSGATQGAITSGLAGAGSGLLSTLAFGPFQEQLRRTLGLDRVNVAVRTTTLGTSETELTLGKSLNLLGQRSAFVLSHKKSGELTITSGQVEWRFGDFILQLGASKSGSSGLGMSGDVRHTWSPK